MFICNNNYCRDCKTWLPTGKEEGNHFDVLGKLLALIEYLVIFVSVYV